MIRGPRGLVLQGFFRLEGFRRQTRNSAAALPGMIVPAGPNGASRSAIAQLQAAHTPGPPRPELLPVAMRGPSPALVQSRPVPGAGEIRTTRLVPGQVRLVGDGAPLAPDLRAPLEEFFQVDLSTVRIHEGPAAQAIGALAFTLGEQIHFAPGLYDPASRDGVALLGHELTHVVQQRDGRVANPYGNGIAIVQDPALEAEADRMGEQIASQLWSAHGRFPQQRTRYPPAWRARAGKALTMKLAVPRTALRLPHRPAPTPGVRRPDRLAVLPPARRWGSNRIQLMMDEDLAPREEKHSSKSSGESEYPSTFEQIAMAAAFSDHTQHWLATVLKTELSKLGDEDDAADQLATAVRRAFKYAVPDSYTGKKMPNVKTHRSEKAAQGYVYGSPSAPKEWERLKKAQTIRAMIQPDVADPSHLVACLKAMYTFVHKTSRAPAKYKYLEGGASMEIDPILIYVRIPDGPGNTFADFSSLDAGVYEHVVEAMAPFYYPFGSFHLSVNPLSSKVTSVSAALAEAVRIVASKTRPVTARAVAEAWVKLCLGG